MINTNGDKYNNNIKYEKSNLKIQNEKEKFKKEFISRLIRFSIGTIKFAEKIRHDRNLWLITDQLIRAVTSVGANMVEAKSSSSKKDYIRFFEIALKSANESKYWYLLIKEVVANNELKQEVSELLQEANDISKIIGSSVLTLKGKKQFYILNYNLSFDF